MKKHPRRRGVPSLLLILTVMFIYGLTPVFSQDIPSNQEILLFKYIANGDQASVDSLLYLGTNPNAIYFKQITAIAYAASKGKPAIMNSLIQKGADLELIAEYSMTKATPLGFAVLNDQTPCIEELLQAGAATTGSPTTSGMSFGNMTNSFNWLMHAIKVNSLESARALINAGAPLDYIADSFMDFNYIGKTPLIFAALSGDSSMVKLLIDHGAAINAFGKDWQNKAANSPLMAAAEFGHEDVVRLLIASGANVTIVDETGMTPLLSAARQSQIGTSKILLANGANINDTNENALNALQVSMNFHRMGAQVAMSNRISMSGGAMQYAALMRSAKGEWALSDTTGSLTMVDLQFLDEDIKKLQLREALESVILDESDVFNKFKYENLLYTKFLIEHGIDMDHLSQGKSAAMMAQQFRLDESLGALLDAGANTSGIPASALLTHSIKQQNFQRFRSYYNNAGQISDSLKCALLGSASIVSNNQIIEFMLNHGASIDCTDLQGLSSLHLATYSGNKQTVDLLIAKGADKSLADRNGVTPYMIAKYMDKKDVIQALSVGNAIGIAPINIGYSLAEVEKKYNDVYNPVIAGMINLYSPYIYSNALDKGISFKDPLIAWLNQKVADSIKWKYATALFSQGFLETQGASGALTTFKNNQAYKSWDDFTISLSGNYKTGGNGRVSFTAGGTNKFTKVEDKDDTHDRSSSITFHLQEFETLWGSFVPEYNAGMGVFIGACGGWDNHCIMVIDGDCYSFSDADARTADVSYNISGSYRIPGITTFNGAPAAYPRVEILNYDKSVPLKVIQGSNTVSIDANETKTFNRQQGALEIKPQWNASVSASGGNCSDKTHQSAFRVKYPSTFDVNLRFNGTSFSDRLKNYSDIYLMKKTYQEGADTLSSIDLYGLSSTILLKSELAKSTYKDIVKAELVGIVDFLENTNFTNINDGLILLAQSEQLSIQDVRMKIQQLLAIDDVDQVITNQLIAMEADLDNLTLSEARDKLKAYKQSYLKTLNEKIARYNLLLMEYAMFIPNESLIQQLNLDRIPIMTNYLNDFARFRFNL